MAAQDQRATAAQRRGWRPEDLQRAAALAGGALTRPAEIRRVLDGLGYLDEWRDDYCVRSARQSLGSDRITCIDAAVLAYALLDLFEGVPRALLALHRCDAAGEECGHVVTLYWGADGRVGAFSKSSFPGLDHRDAVYPDEHAVALSYAEAYVRIGMQPLYYGVTTLEEVASDLDWRFDSRPLNVLSDRIQARYAYGFELQRRPAAAGPQ